MKSAMTMDQLKSKVNAMNKMADMVKSKTPQQLANYSSQFKGTNQDLSDALKSGEIESNIASNSVPNTEHLGGEVEDEEESNSKPMNGNYIPKKTKSGFISKKS